MQEQRKSLVAKKQVYISHDDSEILDFSNFENLKIYYYFVRP